MGIESNYHKERNTVAMSREEKVKRWDTVF